MFVTRSGDRFNMAGTRETILWIGTSTCTSDNYKEHVMRHVYSIILS
jgi:hypothetical protein